MKNINKVKKIWSRLTEKEDSIYLVIGTIMAVIAIIIQIIFGGKFSITSAICGFIGSFLFLGLCDYMDVKICELRGVFGISLIYFTAIIILTITTPRSLGLIASWIIWEILVCKRSPQYKLMLVMVGFCANLLALIIPVGYLMWPHL